MLYCTLHVLLSPDLWYVMRDPLFQWPSPQKTPNMLYLSTPIRRIETLRISELHYVLIRRIETLRISELHYVLKHEKQKLLLQTTLRDGDQ